AEEGFHAGETDYEAEVEWGSKHQTVSFARTKPVTLSGKTNLPGGQDARKVAVEEMPGKLNRVVRPGWAATLLSEAHIFGPVQGRRWKGRRPGIDDHIDIEVWEVLRQDKKGYEYVVEASFKKKNLDATQAASNRLKELLAE